MERTLRSWFRDIGFRDSYPEPKTTLSEFWACAGGPALAFLLVRMSGAEGWPDRQQVCVGIADLGQGWADELAGTPEWGEREARELADTLEEQAETLLAETEGPHPDGADEFLAWQAETLRSHFPVPGPLVEPLGDQPWVLLARAEQQIAELKSRLAELEAGVSIISEYTNRVEPPEGAVLTALALLSDGGKPCPDCADGDDPGYLTSLDEEGEPYPHFCPRCGGMAIVAREGA